MKIETKFDIGQMLFYINRYNEVKKGVINKIIFTQDDVYYGFSWTDHAYREYRIFTTREEAEAKLKKMQDERGTIIYARRYIRKYWRKKYLLNQAQKELEEKK